MKRGICLKEWEVEAFNEGRKTQLRRVVKKLGRLHSANDTRWMKEGEFAVCPDMFPTSDTPKLVVAYCEHVGCTRMMGSQAFIKDFSPLGQPGDTIFFNETWRIVDFVCVNGIDLCAVVEYKDGTRLIRNSQSSRLKKCGWRSPATMPRWASRIAREITQVRLERVHSITETDAVAEGIQVRYGPGDGAFRDAITCRYGLPEWEFGKCEGNAKLAYKWAWHQDHKRSGETWPDNPWAWIYELKDSK